MKKIALTTAGISLSAALIYFVGAATCTALNCSVQLKKPFISSFEDCRSAGFPIITDADPDRCVIDENTFYVDEEDFIDLTSPRENQLVDDSFAIKGRGKVIDNTLFYSVKIGNNILQEGQIEVGSEEHGRWGDFSKVIQLSNLDSGSELQLEFSEGVDRKLLKSIRLNYDARQETRILFDPLDEFNLNDIQSRVQLDVPFSPQAPFANWSHPYDEACEEISLIMAYYYSTDDDLTYSEADRQIVDLVEWEQEKGYAVDINVSQLSDIAFDYYGVQSAIYSDDAVSVNHLKWLLSEGYPVIIPAAGQKLGNPNFRGAGPPYHMLVLTGYDEDGFISNDPGTKRGQNYHYSYEVIMDAIHDWNGSKENIESGKKSILVIEK